MGSWRTSVVVESYLQAEAFLGDKFKRRYPVGKVTFIERINATRIGVRYQKTFIVEYDSNGMVILNTGGWFTVTSKAKINEFTNKVSVYSSLGKWYVSTAAGVPKTYDFHDRMHIYPSGQVMIDEGQEHGYQPAPEANERMDRAAYRRGRRFNGRRAIPARGEDTVWQRQGVCRGCDGLYGPCSTCGRTEYVMPNSPVNSVRDEVEHELEERDRAWRANAMRTVTNDASDEHAVYVPEFARGNGKA